MTLIYGPNASIMKITLNFCIILYLETCIYFAPFLAYNMP